MDPSPLVPVDSSKTINPVLAFVRVSAAVLLIVAACLSPLVILNSWSSSSSPSSSFSRPSSSVSSLNAGRLLASDDSSSEFAAESPSADPYKWLYIDPANRCYTGPNISPFVNGSLFNYTVIDIDYNKVNLGVYSNNIIMVTNVASY